MGRTASTVLIAAGAAAIWMNVHSDSTRYSDDSIWKRQSLIVERYVRDAPAKTQKLGELRAGLSELGPSSREERCRFETRFEALVVNRGNAAAAEAAIASRSFEPYAECKPDVQKDNLIYNWTTIVPAILAGLGVLGMAGSFLGKKDKP
jgi:hypothetical protein